LPAHQVAKSTEGYSDRNALTGSTRLAVRTRDINGQDRDLDDVSYDNEYASVPENHVDDTLVSRSQDTTYRMQF